MSIVNKLLGFPDDARLLIVNADDFGMCHAINQGTLRTLENNIVQSTTLMTTCPWTLHAIALLQENPDISFGVHLTLICETVNYKWGPLTSREKVASLVNEEGYFYSTTRMSNFMDVAQLNEIEIEFRAQIECVLKAGLQPTHVDWHCLFDGGRSDIFELTLALAAEYGLAIRLGGRPLVERLLACGLPVNEHGVLDSFRLDPASKSAHYEKLLRELPVGLSEWAVHPAIENDELLTLEPEGNHVRQTDFDFLTSAKAREIVDEEGIILLNYQSLQIVWQNNLQ